MAASITESTTDTTTDSITNPTSSSILAIKFKSINKIVAYCVTNTISIIIDNNVY